MAATGHASGSHDAVVVGAGPNGLAAAIRLAAAGCRPLVLEAAPEVGGGVRSAEVTLPGFLHDLCSAVYPFGPATPALADAGLEDHGLAWIRPPLPLAHPLDRGDAALLQRDLDATCAGLEDDGAAYRALFAPLLAGWEALLGDVTAPLRVPRAPLVLGRFAASALRSASGLVRARFAGDRARALVAGIAAHSAQPLDRTASASFGLVLGLLGHATGWPIVRGGAQRLADALAARLRALGGTIETGVRVRSLDELPPARAVLLDVSPRSLLRLAGDRLPAGYRRALERYRYGPGVFKIDYALDAPIPWAAPACGDAGTVHVVGGLAELEAAMRAVGDGAAAERPFVLVAQPSRFDPSRAPPGKHTAWAYCHVPNGSTLDRTAAIEAQIERFAPGFRERVLARHTRTALALEAHDPNFVGGDINVGAADLRQLVARPMARWVPYATPVPGLYLCSAATPPGGGVHGMCGHHAAGVALRRLG